MMAEANVPLSISHVSREVAAKMIIPTTLSVMDETNAEMMD
jgi:hypothetical protein